MFCHLEPKAIEDDNCWWRNSRSMLTNLTSFPIHFGLYNFRCFMCFIIIRNSLFFAFFSTPQGQRFIAPSYGVGPILGSLQVYKIVYDSYNLYLIWTYGSYTNTHTFRDFLYKSFGHTFGLLRVDKFHGDNVQCSLVLDDKKWCWKLSCFFLFNRCGHLYAAAATVTTKGLKLGA